MFLAGFVHDAGLVVLGEDAVDEAPWYANHSKDCGTKYRGCAPDCPKDAEEKRREADGED